MNTKTLISKQYYYFILRLLLIIFLPIFSICENSREKRNLVLPFKYRSIYGLFLALALPLDIPKKNVFISYNFEGNYYLPYNTSELGDMSLFAPITEIRVKRQISRRLIYTILEDKLKRSGFKGRACLLRIICEASLNKLYDNGVLGNIIHIILSPSTSSDEGLPLKFYGAEKSGNDGDCTKYNSQCSESVLDTMSRII